MTFAKTVLQNGVFNPFMNLVGRLLVALFGQQLMIRLVSFETSRYRKLVELTSFLRKFFNLFINSLIIIKMKQENLVMSVIHPHAAGIDAGSRSHFVAVG